MGTLRSPAKVEHDQPGDAGEDDRSTCYRTLLGSSHRRSVTEEVGTLFVWLYDLDGWDAVRSIGVWREGPIRRPAMDWQRAGN